MQTSRLFWKIIKSQERAFFHLCLAICGGVLAGACTAALIASIHRTIKSGLNEDLGLSLTRFALLWLGHGLFGICSTWAITTLSQNLLHSMRVAFAKSVLAVTYAQLESIGKSKLMATLSHTIKVIAETTERLPGLVIRLVLLGSLYFYLFLLSPPLFFAVVVFLISGVFMYIWPTSRYRAYQKAEIGVMSEVIQHIHALLEGLKALLQSRDKRVGFLKGYYEPTSNRARRVTVRLRLIESLIDHWGELYLLLGLGIILFFFPSWGLATYEEMGDFLLIFLFTLNPMTTVINYYYRLRQLGVALEDYHAVGLQLANPQGEEGAHAAVKPALPTLNRLRFEEISYVYTDFQNQQRDYLFDLGPISFNIDHPQIIFVTGGNGSGKSTLVKLLCGLYSPKSGTVFWNGKPIDDGNRDAYTERFAVIHFDFFLFDSLLGLEEEEIDVQANDLLHELGLAHKVQITDGTFSTHKLSQGQRKRLMLLQAYLDNKPISIFDEFAADQDPEFKKYFYESWVPKLKAEGKTVILVSHDDSYFHVADQIIKLVDGKLEDPSVEEMSSDLSYPKTISV